MAARYYEKAGFGSPTAKKVFTWARYAEPWGSESAVAVVLFGQILALVVLVGLNPAPIKPPPRPAPTTRLRATLMIAPTAEALTFARLGEGAMAKTHAVKTYQNGSVSGVDLTSLLQPR